MKRLLHEIIAFSERHSELSVLLFASIIFALSNLLIFLGVDALSWLVGSDHGLSQTLFQLTNALVLTLFFLLLFCVFATLRLFFYYIKEVIEIEKKYWRNK